MINNKLSLAAVLLIYYLLFPLFVWWHLSFDLASDRFPVNADSIILPFAGMMIIWMVGFGFIAFIIWAIKKTDLADLLLFETNKDRFALSVFISVISGVFICLEILVVIERISSRDLLSALYAGFGIYTVLCLRVVFTFFGRTYLQKPNDDLKKQLSCSTV